MEKQVSLTAIDLKIQTAVGKPLPIQKGNNVVESIRMYLDGKIEL